MYCPECGKESSSDSKYCSACGSPLHVATNESSTSNQHLTNEEEKLSDAGSAVVRKSPSTAAILSFLFAGSGQVYNGQLVLGVFLMLLAGCAGWLITSNSARMGGAVLCVSVYIGGCIHAYSTAKKMNGGTIPFAPYKNSHVALYAILLLGILVAPPIAVDVLTAKAYVSAVTVVDDDLQDIYTYVYGGFIPSANDYALNYTLVTTATNVGYVDARNIRAVIYLYSPRDESQLLSQNVDFGDLPPDGQSTQHIPITLRARDLNDFKRLYEYGPSIKVVVTNVEN